MCIYTRQLYVVISMTIYGYIQCNVAYVYDIIDFTTYLPKSLENHYKIDIDTVTKA